MTSVIELLLPVMIILAPALLVYTHFKNFTGLACGIVIGIILGIGSGILPLWTVTLAILLLASLFISRGKGAEE